MPGDDRDRPAADAAGVSEGDAVDGDPHDGDAADGDPATDALDAPDVEDLIDELEDLEAAVDDAATREQVRATIRVARRVGTGGTFGRVIRGFDRADAAEALVGSVVFGIPIVVEGGTLEVGAFVATHALYFLGTVAAGVGIVVGLLYVSDIQDVRIVDPFFGFLPRRLVGVLTISATTALVLMTAWGRVDWAEPWVAICQVSVCFVAMAIGAALGDILPGS